MSRATNEDLLFRLQRRGTSERACRYLVKDHVDITGPAVPARNVKS